MRVSGTADLLCRKCFFALEFSFIVQSRHRHLLQGAPQRVRPPGLEDWAGQGGSRPGFRPGFRPGLSSAAAGCTSGHCPSGRWSFLLGNRLRSVRPGVVRDGPAHRPAPRRLDPRDGRRGHCSSPHPAPARYDTPDSILAGLRPFRGSTRNSMGLLANRLRPLWLRSGRAAQPCESLVSTFSRRRGRPVCSNRLPHDSRARSVVDS